MDVRTSIEFSNLKKINDLARKLVETKKGIRYHWFIKLLTLILILTIAIAIVEREFSYLKIKNQFRNRISDQWMHDTLVMYVNSYGKLSGGG